MEYYGEGKVEEQTGKGEVEEHTSRGVVELKKSEAKVSVEIFYYSGSSFGEESYTDLRGQYFA